MASSFVPLGEMLGSRHVCTVAIRFGRCAIKKGETRAVLVDSDFDVLLLTLGEPVGQARERQFALPPLMKPGFYTVQISFGDPTGTPVIALPLDTVDGLRRYRIGELRIE